MSHRLAESRVLIAEARAHRRVELFLFADSPEGPFHVLSFSGGHGRLPSLEKGQGPLQDIDNARFVMGAIVAELGRMGYQPEAANASIWEVYARKVHRQLRHERSRRTEYDDPPFEP